MTESKEFATWLINHTDEVKLTAGAYRRYKGKILNVDELYDIFKIVYQQS